MAKRKTKPQPKFRYVVGEAMLRVFDLFGEALAFVADAVGWVLVKVLFTRKTVCVRCKTPHGDLSDSVMAPFPFSTVNGECRACGGEQLRVYPW